MLINSSSVTVSEIQIQNSNVFYKQEDISPHKLDMRSAHSSTCHQNKSEGNKLAFFKFE